MKKMMYLLMTVVMLAGLFIPAVAAEEQPTVSVIITAAGDVEAVINQVEALDGEVTHVYRNFPMLVAEVTTDAAVTLSGLDIVEDVSKNQMRTLEPPSADATREGAELLTHFSLIEDEGTDILTAEEAADKGLPDNYYNYGASGAPYVWFAPDGNLGQDTTIAIVDTGVRVAQVWPQYPPVNWCLGYLIEPNNPLPYARIYPGYNAYPDGASATDLDNHWHGTHVAQTAASNCWMGLVRDFPYPDPIQTAQNNALIDALLTHNPNGIYADPVIPEQYWVPVLGPAPEAKIYPVKVFPKDGGSSPDSVIIDGLDHLLTVKKEMGIDIDVVNMSLGGGTGYDGWDAYYKPIRMLTKAGMLVVTSAGNAGPVPNSIGTPATDFRALSVGGTNDPIPVRVLREYQGLFLGWDGIPMNGNESAGWGSIVRPDDDIRVTDFSSRGPLSDGRMGPDVVASGRWHFAGYFRPDPNNPIGVGGVMRWASGTSFSSPVVAGAAALLNTWWEQNHAPWNEQPGKIANAIMLGADPDKISDDFETRDMGFGYIDIPAAWTLLRAKAVPKYFITVWDHVLYNNIGWDCDDTHCVYESDTVTLRPSDTFDKIFEMHPEIHDQMHIELFDVVGTQDNIFYNTADLYVKSAKRTALPYVIEGIGVGGYDGLWVPNPSDAWVNVQDGNVAYGGNGTVFAPYDANTNWAMEPGQWKVSVAASDTNNDEISFRLRITKTFRWDPPGEPWQEEPIETGDEYTFYYEVPSGANLSKLTFDLAWNMDWDKFPTNDIDMEVSGPGGFYSADGMSASSPEQVVIENPAEGTYTIKVIGYEVYVKDIFKLYVTTE
jgi:hypothetical protein